VTPARPRQLEGYVISEIMTMNEYIKGRGKLLRNWTFAWVGVFLVTVFLLPGLFRRYTLAYFVVVFVGLSAIDWAIGKDVRCPKCAKRLWQPGRYVSNPMLTKPHEACPHCEVSFEKPLANLPSR
jgi:hypothetical protein